jgi:hypothetical protein
MARRISTLGTFSSEKLPESSFDDAFEELTKRAGRVRSLTTKRIFRCNNARTGHATRTAVTRKSR